MLALALLAREYGKAPVPIGRIAKSELIPQRFLEGILLTLKNEGILDSTRGKNGGYYLLRNPEDVTLLDVLICFEGSVSMLACVCEDVYKPCEFCKDESVCPIRKPFSEIYRHTIEILRKTTLSSLAQNFSEKSESLSGEASN